MHVRNVEFKARVRSIQPFETRLLTRQPEFRGTDHQVDTYFNVPRGRLKLREGNIENALIQYDREDVKGAKLSRVTLFRFQPDPALKEILTRQFGVWKVVDKMRRIYFIGHVKFHFDVVRDVGQFIEVEVIDEQGRFSQDELDSQCREWIDFFDIDPSDMEARSYSDLIAS